MELILNTNKFGFIPFLETNVDSFIIGLKNFCINQPFSLTIKELKKCLPIIKDTNKKIYLSINLFAKENDIKKLLKILDNIISLNVDGYIVSDLGILNMLKKKNQEHKVILDLQTYVTNKYSANSLLNLGIKRISLSKEITLNDIKEIANFNNKNIEVLCQGYYPITYSKRPILSCYFKNFKLKKTSNIHYIKEENRNDYYFVLESKNNLTVYNNRQYSLFNNLPELIKNNISSLRIDSIFMNEIEIKEYINLYSLAIDSLTNNNIEEYNKLKTTFNNKYDFDTPFLYNESFLLKEGK